MKTVAGCGAVDAGRRCGASVDDGAALGLCADHLLAAYDWIARDVGVTDLLPSPCLACGSRLGIRYPTGWLCAVCEWRYGQIPDADDQSIRVEVVYYLRFRDRIKIGTSSNPRSRLAQLRYEELLAFERGGLATEQKRHGQFAAHRFEGSEWFRVNSELTDHICSVAAGTENPWDLYRRWLSEEAAIRG